MFLQPDCDPYQALWSSSVHFQQVVSQWFLFSHRWSAAEQVVQRLESWWDSYKWLYSSHSSSACGQRTASPLHYSLLHLESMKRCNTNSCWMKFHSINIISRLISSRDASCLPIVWSCSQCRETSTASKAHWSMSRCDCDSVQGERSVALAASQLRRYASCKNKSTLKLHYH